MFVGIVKSMVAAQAVNARITQEKRLKAVKAAVKEEPIEETEKEDKREPKPEVEPSTAGSKVLDLMTKENNKAHVTSMYKDKAYIHAKSSVNLPKIGADRLIVRRGQEFTVRSSVGAPTISFNPCGMFKSEVRSTSDCGVKSKVAITDWKIKGQDGTYTIKSSPLAPVGVYTINEAQEFVLLFNPFNSRSDVGGSSRMKLGEKYVLEEKSMIFQGTSDDHDGHVWDLDSFRGLNLIVALRLLRHLKLEQRGQAYIVSRHLTFSIGDEVCYGKWGDGSYTSGRPAGGYRCSKDTWYKNCHDPSTFPGTSGLLEYHYGLVMSNERSSQVQYCQCFVFAGVTATIGRTLGIPTTIVTTFQSAHDTNGDRSISKFYEIDDDDTWVPIEDPNKNHGVGHGDSVWSFHVWNEMWVRRTDIRKKPRGWNAVDATPQEHSHGRYQMGPAPLSYVKKNRDGCYDNQFVISEVNADIKLFARKKGTSEEFKQHDSNYAVDPFGDEMNTVGVLITTSKPGCDFEDNPSEACKLDVTSKYKKKEPSSPGKPSKSSRSCTNIVSGERKPLVVVEDNDVSLIEEGVKPQDESGTGFNEEAKGDVKFDVSFPKGKLEVGGTSTVTVNMKNDGGGEKRTVSIVCVAYGLNYNGRRIIYKTTRSGPIFAKIAYHAKKKVTLGEGESAVFNCPIKLDETAMQMIGIDAANTANIEITLSASVKETGKKFIRERKKRLSE